MSVHHPASTGQWYKPQIRSGCWASRGGSHPFCPSQGLCSSRCIVWSLLVYGRPVSPPSSPYSSSDTKSLTSWVLAADGLLAQQSLHHFQNATFWAPGLSLAYWDLRDENEVVRVLSSHTFEEHLWKLPIYYRSPCTQCHNSLLPLLLLLVRLVFGLSAQSVLRVL